jgi:hypothetical protein
MSSRDVRRIFADHRYLGDDLGWVGTAPFTRITTTVVLTTQAEEGSIWDRGGKQGKVTLARIIAHHNPLPTSNTFAKICILVGLLS